MLFYPKIAPETISEGLKSKNFPTGLTTKVNQLPTGKIGVVQNICLVSCAATLLATLHRCRLCATFHRCSLLLLPGSTAEIGAAAAVMAEAMKLTINEIVLQRAQCLARVGLFTAHFDRTAGRTSESPAHLLCESPFALVGRIFLYQFLQSSTIALACMVGTFQLPDDESPHWHTLQEG